MWENERKKTIVRNIIICAVLVVIAIGLLVGLQVMRKQIAAEDALLSQEHNSQRQELNDAREGSMEVVQAAYQADLDALAQYLPGIVCWGDSLTAGSSGNVSYPLTLQKYINTYLCDIYDLRYGVDNPENYARVNWEEYKISIPVVNLGSGQEDTETILGRSGVVPYVAAADFVIPAGTESVGLSIVSENGKTVTPLTAGNAGVNPVTINGVEGTLTRTANSQLWSQYSYQFTRLEAGEETPVSKGTEIVTACTEEYRDYVHIVWLGTYGEFTNPETLVAETEALLSRQTENSDRYLVIGPCTYKGSWDPLQTYSMDAIDSAMLQAFGNRYINLRKYLIEDGLRDAGITATKNDTTNISQGEVPDSFRSNAGGADLNGVAYELLGKLIYDRMDLLGYFDEVREELNLEKITQDILKSDPSYFENALK